MYVHVFVDNMQPLILKIAGQKKLESIHKRAIHITRGMSYPNVLFVAELGSLKTRRNNQSRSFFRTFANQPPVFTISFHLREIPHH